ncbi:MAG: hypothetical protein ACTHJL_02110 [Amnibacterium sp.]
MKTNLRLWVIGSVAAMVALVGGGFLVGVQPMLNIASAATLSAQQLASTNQATTVHLAQLASVSQHIDTLKAEEAAAAAAVPEALDANAFVDRVNALAAKTGVKVQSVTPSPAQAYAPPASAQAAAQAAAAAQQPAGPAPTASPAAPAAVSPVLAATDPSITGANLTVVPMTVSVRGSIEGTLQFTQALQHDTRLFLVSGYSLSKDGVSGSKVLASLTGAIYTLKH